SPASAASTIRPRCAAGSSRTDPPRPGPHDPPTGAHVRAVSIDMGDSRRPAAQYGRLMATSARATNRSSAAPKEVPHLTVAERAARGKAARAEVPRSSHGAFAPPARRKDPVKLLE